MTTTTILEPTDETFDAEVLGSEGPVLVDFWAPWCGPCNAFKPVVQAVVGARETGLSAAFINIDDNPGLAQRFGIQSIPAIRLFRGGELVAQHTGGLSKAAFEDWLKKQGV